MHTNDKKLRKALEDFQTAAHTALSSTSTAVRIEELTGTLDAHPLADAHYVPVLSHKELQKLNAAERAEYARARQRQHAH